jgi:hypothetical protein
MAWQARLSAAVFAADEKVVATFEFFDDVNPTTIFARRAFTFDPSWTNTDMQNAVRSVGAQFRTANLRATALATAFPVGTLIAIP